MIRSTKTGEEMIGVHCINFSKFSKIEVFIAKKKMLGEIKTLKQ